MPQKKHQPAFNTEQLIANLKEKKLIIEDEEYAKAFFDENSYFRVIKAYSIGLKERNGYYYEGVTFEQIIELYTFNTQFRRLLFPLIERIEITLRARIASYFSDKYGVLGYLERMNFTSKKHHEVLLKDIRRETKYNHNSPFIKNFQNNYEGGKIPLYALVEVLTFGTLSKFYKNMLNEDKKIIASKYGITYRYLQSWIENISHVRNICAHYGRLYNAKLSKTPELYQEYRKLNIHNYYVFATLLCIKHLIPNDYRWEVFIDSLSELFKNHPHAKMNTMGFPGNWQELLIIK